jgi:S1-C subfamily serine protease
MQRAVPLKITLVVVLAAVVVGGLVGAVVGLGLDGHSGGSNATPVDASSEIPASSRKGLSPEQLYARDARSVVVITSTQTEQIPGTFFTPPSTERVSALGSGFVIDKQGDILTNDHVVQGGTHVRVGFSSGASYPARTIGVDASTDVAVVRVDAPASALDRLQFDDSSAIAVGDPVYAIGNPFGLDRTMTSGIVSATGRDIQAPDGLTIPNAIQTDAPINHGNSGGPLLDRYGRVIGINAQIESGSGGNVGIGFAIPGNRARTVAGELIKSGRAVHAWLGVDVVTIDPGLAAHMRGLPKRGVAIAHVVTGSPAAKAGMKGATGNATIDGESVPVGGDAIVAVDGSEVSTSERLADDVAAHRPGDRLQIAYVRAGKRRSVVVTLANAPSTSP